MAIVVKGAKSKNRFTDESGVVAPGSDFVFRTTKPTAANTGAGVIRAYPTITLNPGDAVPGGTWSGDVLTMSTSLSDRVINGRLKRSTSNTVFENLVITSNPSYPISAAAGNSSPLVDMGGASTGTVLRYCTLRGGYQSTNMNGIMGRYYTAELNDISGVVDPISPTLTGGIVDVQIVVRGNYIHNLTFYAPDPGHSATPSTTPDGRVVVGPWAGQPWTHCDGMQLSVTGIDNIQFYGNNVLANWSADPTVSTLPLPVDGAGNPALKELSCIMITLDTGSNVHIDDNWFDYAEYAMNMSTGHGTAYRNKFGPNISLGTPGDRSTAYGIVNGGSILTGAGTSNQNVWESDGTPIRVR